MEAGEKETALGERKWGGRESTQPGPTFSLVYATPLLQHQAQIGLSPARSPRILCGQCQEGRDVLVGTTSVRWILVRGSMPPCRLRRRKF